MVGGRGEDVVAEGATTTVRGEGGHVEKRSKGGQASLKDYLTSVAYMKHLKKERAPGK